MKSLSVILFILILLLPSNKNEFKYWEQFTTSEKEHYLSNPELNKTALDYYRDKFRVNDDDLTYALLDTLTNNKNFTPFYYYLFNKICTQSDGALSEVMGIYCFNVLMNNPDYVVGYLTFERKNLKKELYNYQLYGLFIGYEMYSYNEGTSNLEMRFTKFKKLLNERFYKSTTDNKETLLLFFNEIEKTIKEMD